MFQVETMVSDARSKGGHVVCGGSRSNGLFYEPTLIDNANTNMQCVQEESFGPILPILKYIQALNQILKQWV